MKYVTTFALVLSFFITPATAHALIDKAAPQPVFEIGKQLGMMAVTTANTGTSAVNTTALNAKENILDAIAFSLKEATIAAITQSIINWINSGFEGGPSFVTDLDAFLGELSDQVSLDFIEGTELGFLCSPFELEIRLALATQNQPFQDRIRCSLGDVTDNIEDFLGGDFSNGGWPAWFRLHADIQNNPYGAYGQSLGELSARINARQDEELALLSFGDGFFSKRECIKHDPEKQDQDGDPVCLAEEIVTPGTQINSQLSEVLGSGFESLELADEINEIVNALIAQLAREALTSINGLRGLSSRSSYSSRSYVDNEGRLIQGSYVEALVQDTNNTLEGNVRRGTVDQTIGATEGERNYNTLVQNILTLLEDDEALVACLYRELGVNGIQRGIENPEELLLFYQGEFVRSQEALVDLETIYDAVLDAETFNRVNAASTAFTTLSNTGTLHSVSERAQIQSDHDLLVTIVDNREAVCTPATEEEVNE